MRNSGVVYLKYSDWYSDLISDDWKHAVRTFVTWAPRHDKARQNGLWLGFVGVYDNKYFETWNFVVELGLKGV